MKTKNNVQKTILSAIIILTGIAILNGSSNAQGFWGSTVNGQDNPLAMKTVKSANLKSIENYNPGVASNSYDYMNLMEIEADSPLTVEEWMVKNFVNGMNKQQTEVQMELKVQKSAPNEKIAVTKKPDNKIYSTSTFVYGNIEDPKLHFEAWMFDSRHWSL